MTDIDLPVEDIDLDFLDDFLLSDRVPEDAMTLSELDGFLAGIAVGPGPIEPQEWLRIVWGGEDAPAFADDAEADAVLGQIFALCDDVLHQIRDGSYMPIFWRDTDGSPLPHGWTHAFCEAIGLRADAWMPLLESDDAAMLIPIYAFCDDESGKPVLPGMTRKERERMLVGSPELIADAVLDIARYWGRVPVAAPPPRQEPVRVAKTPGRNDPCSCGSGRKYKKCCGQSS